MSLFKRAERKRAFLKLAITGPSGSGKTWSSLEIASGMGSKIAVVDTENGSASLYSKDFVFDVVELRPPFTPDAYIKMITAAEEAGYEVLIIDSLSHVWAGEGGVLDQKEALDASGGNQYANWKAPKAAHQKLKDKILHSQIHIISSMRSKQAYSQTDENGRKKIQKVGMDPIAEAGAEYEYTVVLDMAMDHQAQASKDRTGLFDGKIFKPSKNVGLALMKWRNESAEPTPPQEPKKSPPQVESKPPTPPVETRTPHRDPNTFVSSGEHKISKANKEWEGRTIRNVVDEIGLPALLKDVRWWSEESGRKGWREIKELRERAFDFELELHANHADAELTQAFQNSFENDNFEDAFPKGAVK